MRIFEISLIAITAVITFSFAWSIFLTEFREQRDARRIIMEYEQMYLQTQIKQFDVDHIKKTINTLLQQRLNSIFAELNHLKQELLERREDEDIPKISYLMEYMNYAAADLGAQVTAIELSSDQDDNLSEYTNFTDSRINTILTTTNTGDCYSFKGTKCGVIIKLAMEIYIDSIELLYSPKTGDDMSNAPKEFVVYGIADGGEHKYLGINTYDITNKEHTQIFSLLKNSSKFASVRIIFISNHGHPNEICLNKIGIYGSET